MKRAGWIVAGMALAMMSAAQMPPSHGQMGTGSSQGVVPSSRMDFGAQCGIRDSSVESAIRMTRSAEGVWSRVSSDKRPAPTDTGVARVWREHSWMVDIHEAPSPGMSVTRMHTGQMCFNVRGQIMRMMDRYMDMPGCNCMRYTALSFDEASGRIVRREQHFISVGTGSEIAAPESAKEFPGIWEFRRVEQLPFFTVLRK